MQGANVGTRVRLAAAATGCVLLLSPGPLAAQVQTRDQRACTIAMNQAMARVSGVAAVLGWACLRDGGKGKLDPGTTVDACLTADAKGRLAKMEERSHKDFARRCTGVSRRPAGVAKLPPWGVTAAAAVNDAATGGARAVLGDVLGPDLDAAVVREANDRDAARCQQFVARDLRVCQAALLREHNKCKQAGLRSRSAPFTGPAELAACFGADAKGMIAKRCDRREETRPGRFQLDPIRKSLEKRCAGRGVDLASALPGCAAASVEEAHACLARAARCRACGTVAAADGLALDCDLLDDGAANGSCAAAPLGRHVCTLDAESGFLFESQAGFLGGLLAGSVEIDCGVVDPATGRAACTCALGAVDPVAVPGLGWACSGARPGCADGEIACAGGVSLDFRIDADHDVAACAGNADCAASCAAHCAAGGGEVWGSACEGFCAGGSADGAACTSGAQCPGGSCNGVAGGGHGNVCQCQCIDRAGGAPSVAGGLRCDLGVRISVEAALPCDGTDVLLDVGDRCLPFTTEGAQATLVDQDHVPGRRLPAGVDLLGGSAVTCEELRAGGASGMVLASAANAFDVPSAGDVYLLFFLGCD